MPWLRRSPPWDEPTYWALDLETSGVEPGRDQILSVGMVPLRRGAIVWGERFYSLVRPATFEGLTEAAIAVHQILPTELRTAPPLGEVLPQVLERLAGNLLLVHHARLDVRFLRTACKRLRRRWPRPPVVDTRDLVARLDDRRRRLAPYAEPLPRGLGSLRELFGLPVYDYHHALEDALATAELFLVLRARLGALRLRELT